MRARLRDPASSQGQNDVTYGKMKIYEMWRDFSTQTIDRYKVHFENCFTRIMSILPHLCMCMFGSAQIMCANAMCMMCSIHANLNEYCGQKGTSFVLTRVEKWNLLGWSLSAKYVSRDMPHSATWNVTGMSISRISHVSNAILHSVAVKAWITM